MKNAAGTDPASVPVRTVTLPDGRTLSYELTRKRVRNINLRAKVNGVIRVSANSRVTIAEIERIIAERAEFFFGAFERLRAREENRGIHTDSVKWLGRDYPVRVIESSRECAVIDENECRVFTRHPDEENLTALIGRAVEVSFCALAEDLNAEVRRALEERGYSPPPTRITIKDMSSRWGSNSYTRGHISLNIRLAPYPRGTVLAVLWHEYAHYWHHDHSRRFYDFVTAMYPDYYKWDNLLKR